MLSKITEIFPVYCQLNNNNTVMYIFQQQFYLYHENILSGNYFLNFWNWSHTFLPVTCLLLIPVGASIIKFLERFCIKLKTKKNLK